MAKSAVFGINEVTLANPVVGSFPTDFSAEGSFSFKAIVKDSVKFTDEAASDNDIEVEETDNLYAQLVSSVAKKGLEIDTYDLSEEAYIALQGFTKASDYESTGWIEEPTKIQELTKAVQIVTRAIEDFPSKTFQWAKMKIKVTKAGTIGKSGFPNFHLVLTQLANFDGSGKEVTGHRWKLTKTE